MIDEARLKQWTEQARRDDWHQTFVGSDIREMLGEISRLQGTLTYIRAQARANHPGALSVIEANADSALTNPSLDRVRAFAARDH